jgi:hypothetical protein
MPNRGEAVNVRYGYGRMTGTNFWMRFPSATSPV